LEPNKERVKEYKKITATALGLDIPDQPSKMSFFKRLLRIGPHKDKFTEVVHAKSVAMDPASKGDLLRAA
jgi:hypothetical protein